MIPSMRAQQSGIIATMGSIAGWAAVPGTGVYSAGKTAMTTMCMQALREEVVGHFRTELLSEQRVVRA